jgi:hypothetical protein
MNCLATVTPTVTDLFDRASPYAVAGVGIVVTVTPLIARYGSVASIRATESDLNLGVALAGFILSILSLYLGIALGLVMTAILAYDLVRRRADASSWSPTYGFVLGGLCHAIGPFLWYAFVPSVPVLTYYLFKRQQTV